jgi:hypothetical protein
VFAKAYKIARLFTLPIVISIWTRNRNVNSIIGTGVVINRDGWFVTAAHILKTADELMRSSRDLHAYEQQCSEIDADAGIKDKDKRRRKMALADPGADAPRKLSLFYGLPNCQLVDIRSFPLMDLAVGQLTPFDASMIHGYPKIKNPTVDFDNGTSLCRLGFPFSEVQPTFDEGKETFNLSAPLPMFPNEGILTRIINIKLREEAAGIPPPKFDFDLAYIETSSPGLKGQSGGPIFDAEGRIWGIQTQTRHYPLGFNYQIKDGGTMRDTAHSFMHVGWGVHAATLIGFLKDNNVEHEVS